ncbi:hypothetical protein EVAR_10327_1 [Eumeta japonica]|uniref:BED-type domain-containing protein n=1 Tax=Eumeta variegata TaxID=151549 RepID=A0A4C1TDS6_EUMVA|nr:hypothetical protein EVAR_10327_1 [Eumeta japonica]
MADLPEERLAFRQRPFTHTGVDYFGPMEVTVGRRREKRWAALFICLTTRAVHMEVASSLSVDSMIMALRRFIARRGQPDTLYSDHGTNFVGAAADLARAHLEIQERMSDEATTRAIRWLRIPPHAPHVGGSWERLVRSIKVALSATLHTRAPRDEILHTLLLEVEFVVNSRPLTHISVLPSDPTALTPNHFLLGSAAGRWQPGHFNTSEECSRKQWRASQALAEMAARIPPHAAETSQVDRGEATDQGRRRGHHHRSRLTTQHMAKGHHRKGLPGDRRASASGGHSHGSWTAETTDCAPGGPAYRSGVVARSDRGWIVDGRVTTALRGCRCARRLINKKKIHDESEAEGPREAGPLIGRTKRDARTREGGRAQRTALLYASAARNSQSAYSRRRRNTLSTSSFRTEFWPSHARRLPHSENGFQSRNTEISVFRDPASFFSPACCGITCAGSRSNCGTVKKHAHDHSRPRTVGFSICSYSSMGRLLTASAARLGVSLPIVKYSSFASNSFVWEHFLKSEDGLSAKCKRCKTVIKTTARSTKGLHVHLKAKHQIEDLNKKVPENAVSSSSVSTNLSMLSPELPSPSKRTKITHHFPIQNSENSMEERVARMTAKDGLPLSVFVTSEDLRELFKAKGFLLPRSSTTIRMMVMNYGMTLRMKVVNELSQLKETGHRFSLTFDEWTSSSNRRYLNINAHTYANDRALFWNLGLTRILEVCQQPFA